MPDDAHLLQLYVQQRSEEAFAQLVRRHINLVYGAALRQLQGDPHRAEEVVQTVFTDLARKASLLSRRTTLAGWLFLAARYAAVSLVRREQRREQREQEAAIMNDPRENVPAETDWERLRPVLDEVLGQLKASDREAVLLRCVEQNTFAEVGQALQLNEDAARRRVDRALDKLQVLLLRRGITSTAGALATVLATEAAAAPPAGLAATVTGTALMQASVAAGTTGTIALKFMMLAKTHGTTLGLLAVATITLGGVVAQMRSQQNEMLKLRSSEEVPAARRDRTPERIVAASSQQRDATPGPYDLDRTEKWTVSEVRKRMEDPEFRKALAVRARARLDSIYGPLFQQLSLSPESVDRLKDLLVERQQAKSDAANAARATGITRQQSPDTFFAAAGIHEKEADEQIKALLGEAAFARFDYYNRALPARARVNQFRDELSPTGEALTPQQVEQLVAAIVRTHLGRDGLETGLTLQVGAGLFRLPIMGFTPEAFEAAKDFLSPNQMKALQDFLERSHQERLAKESAR